MAGEKTTAKDKEVVIEETPVIQEQRTFTFSKDELNELIAGAVTAAVGAKPGTSKRSDDENSKLANSLTRKINERVMEGQKFYALLASSKLRTRVEIPKIYEAYIGKTLTVTINGSTVKVPVDGQQYYMHPAHAAIVKEKLRYISENISRNKVNNELFGDEPGDYGKVGQ